MWKKNSSVCPGFGSDCKMLAQQIFSEFAFQSCYRNFAPIQQVFDIIGILDLTLRCFMAFIFRSKNRIFLRLITHSKIRNVVILTAKVTTSQLLRQKIMILYYCPFKKHFYLTNNGFHHSVH